jgi:hypothetical protein
MQEGIYWDLSNGANSGRVALGTNAVPSFDSTSKMIFNTGDSLILYYKKHGWSVTAGIINKTTGLVTATTFNQRWSGSGGRWNLIFLNGTYHLTNAKVTVHDRRGGAWFFGDSQTGGYGNTTEAYGFPDLVFNSNHKYFGVWGLPSLSAKYFVDGGLVSEVINDVQPTKAVIAYGYNDQSEAFTVNATKANIDSIVYPLQRAGIQVGTMGIVPRNSATDLWNTGISEVAASRGSDFYDIRTPLINSSSTFNINYNADGVHVNDSGSLIIARVVISKSGDSLLSEMSADTNYVAKLLNLPTTKADNVDVVGIKKDGSLVSIANKFPTPAGWIKNGYTTATGQMPPLQATSSIYLSGYVATDTGFVARSTQGGRFSWANNNATSTTGSNLDMNNGGIAGTGLGISFLNITGSGNVRIAASSTNKTKATLNNGSISGNNNTLLNSYLGTAFTGSNLTAIGTYSYSPTSGDNNILIGSNAGRGVTAGGNLINLITRNTSAMNMANVSDAFISGDLSSQDADNLYQANDWAWSGNNNSNANFWFGGRGNGFSAREITMNAVSAYNAANVAGEPWYFRASKGRGTAATGGIYFQTWNAAASGSTLQSVANTELTILRDSFQVDAKAKFNQSVSLPYVAKTSTYVITTSDHTIDCTSGTFTTTLPTAASMTGVVYTIKNSGAGAITVACNGAETIDGAATYPLATQYKYVTVQSNGTNWIVTANN